MRAYVGPSTNSGVLVRVLYEVSTLALTRVFTSFPRLVVIKTTPFAPREP